MMDKLFFVTSPRSLRCSSKIFPMLCPILIGPLFHQGFHTKDGLNFLLAHGHGPVRPRLLFLSPSITKSHVSFIFHCLLIMIWLYACLTELVTSIIDYLIKLAKIELK